MRATNHPSSCGARAPAAARYSLTQRPGDWYASPLCLAGGVRYPRPGRPSVAYTDGLCDATNPAGDEWGWQRLVRRISETVDRPVRDIVEGVIESVETFSRGQRFDDITLWIGRARDESALDTFATATTAESPEVALSAAA